MTKDEIDALEKLVRLELQLVDRPRYAELLAIYPQVFELARIGVEVKEERETLSTLEECLRRKS